MLSGILAAAIVTQWASWSQPAMGPGTMPWGAPTAAAGWGQTASPWTAAWGSAAWAPPMPSGAETDPIRIPFWTDLPGTADRAVHYGVYAPGGAVVVAVRAIDADLDLEVWPAGRTAKAISRRADPVDAVVLVSPDDPWILIRVAPAGGRAAPRTPVRFILRVAPAAVGEAPVWWPGAGGTEITASAPPMTSWGAFGSMAPAWPQAASPAQAMPWPSTPPAPRPAPPPAEAPSAEAPSAERAPAAAEAPPAATRPAPPPPAPVEAPAPLSPTPPAEADADAPPGVAGVVRPGGGAVAGTADADTYLAIRVDEARPFVVRLESQGGADHDLVVWASNGSRSWESSRRGDAAEEVVVDPVTDSWYIVRIAVRTAGRFTLRVWHP